MVLCSSFRTLFLKSRTALEIMLRIEKSVRFSEHLFGIKLLLISNFGLSQPYAK
jgi:hypothetical protein